MNTTLQSKVLCLQQHYTVFLPVIVFDVLKQRALHVMFLYSHNYQRTDMLKNEQLNITKCLLLPVQTTKQKEIIQQITDLITDLVIGLNLLLSVECNCVPSWLPPGRISIFFFRSEEDTL